MNRIFKKVHLLGLVALLLGFAPNQTWAQLGVYGFTGNDNTADSWPVNAQPSNATMSNFYRGPGIKKPTGAGSVGTFTSNSWTMAATRNDSDYYQFSVKPMVGMSFRLDSIVLREARSGTGITQWSAYTSRDSYATSVQDFTVPDVTTFRNNQKVVFGGASFNNITDSVGVRFYGYGAEGNNGTWRMDSVRVYGVVSNGGNPTPVIITMPNNALAFGNVLVGTSVIKSVRVSGTDLSSNLSITSTGVEMSSDSSAFVATSPITLTANNGTVAPTKIFVRVAPSAVGAINGTINLASSGLTKAIAVSANGITNTPAPTNGLYRTIASLRGVNAASGIADSLNKTVIVTGTVHSVNFRAATFLEFAIRDYTGGLHIMKKTANVTPAYTVVEGDSIRVRGLVSQDRGMLHILPDSIKVIATGRMLQAPMLVTALTEATEGSLVKIENLMLTSNSPWGGNNVTAKAFAGTSTDTTFIRLDSDVAITVARPTGTFKVTGIGYQFDLTAPLTEGYQINPRRNSDIETVVSTTPTVLAQPLVNMGTVLVGDSMVRGFRVGGMNLTADIVVSPMANVQISQDSANFVSVASINFTPVAGIVTEKRVFVKVKPMSAGIKNDTVMSMSTGANMVKTVIRTNAATVVAPGSNLYRTIASLRGVNAQGVADSSNRPVVVTGTVHSINFRPAGLEFAIADYTGGIHLFKQTNVTPAYTVTEGDSIRVRATVAQFRGLIQLTIDSVKIIATGRPLQAPMMVTSLSEATEGRLVKMENLTLTSNSVWGGTGNFTAKAFAGTATDTTYIRVDADALITVARPTGTFKVTGIAGQFASNAAPFVGGYQFNPRRNSDIEAGTVVNPPSSNLYRTIGSLRGVNAQGVPDSLNKPVVVIGTVHSINFRPVGLEFTIMDATGGIHISKSAPIVPNYVVTEGDSIRVRGTISQFRGMTIVNPDSIRILATGRTLQTPMVTTVVNESTEGKLLKMLNLTLTSNSPWGGNNITAKAFVGTSTDTIFVRLDADAAITVPRPTGAFNLVGIGYQFINAAPFIGGHQINPRRNSDIEIITGVKGNVSETLKVYPNPAMNFVTVATENATAQTVSVINAAGQVVMSQNIVGQAILNVNNLQSGLYIVKVTSLDGRVSQTRRISVVR